MTTIVFKSNQANYQLPVFPHITYNKVTVELNGGSGGGGPQKGGAGAKLKATVPDITGKNLKITLAPTVTAVNDGGNASYLFNNDEKKYIMVAGGGGGWGGGDGLESVVLLKPILKFGSAYTVAVNAVNDGQGAVVEYNDSTGIRIRNPGQGFTTIPTLTITATDTGETLLLENGINATIRLNANNAKGGSAGGLLGAGGVGAGRSGGKGGSLGVVATKRESGVGGMGGTINNTMVGKSGASITHPPVSTDPNNIPNMLGGEKIGNTPGVGHGGLGETKGGCGGGGWGGGGGGGNYSGGGGGGSFGPIGTVFSSSYEEPFIQFTYLPGLTLENRQADIGILKVCQENYSDTIKYTTQFIGNELTILAARDGLLTTSKFTLTDYYAKVQILDTLSTTLKTVINRSLTLQLNTTNGLFDSTGYLLLNTEQIKYTGKVVGSVNKLTGISRGYNATTALGHPNTVSVLPITFLKNNISDAVQSCTLLTELPGSGTLAGYIMIGSEKIRYTKISTDRLTLSGLIRGAFSTTVAAHTTNEPVKPFTVLTASVAADGATIKVESAVESVAGYILIGNEITGITGITGNTLELTTALTNAYPINEPVYYSYKLDAPLAIPTFDLNQKKDTDTILIKTETIRYIKKTDDPNVLNLISNDPPPDTEYAVDEKVIYAGKNVREFLIGLPRATVGGTVQDVQGQGVPVVNGQLITALGTRHYTLPTGVKKIKIIAVGGSGAGGLLGGLGAKVECVTTTNVTLNLLVGVGAEGQTLNGLNGGGEASIVANTTDGVIHVLAGGGGGAYGTSKISTQDSTTTLLTPADRYVNEYTYAGQVTNDAGGGGGGSGTAIMGQPGGGGSSFPTKGIPAVARGNGSITLMYIEPLVVVRRKGTVLEMRQPVGTEKDLYYSLNDNAVIARSKEGQETETLLPTGITHVRIKSTKSTNDYNTLTLTNDILSGQRISTNGVEKEYTIDPDFKQVKIVLSGACGGSFSADRDGGGEGAELSGYMSLPGTIKVLTGLAGKSTEGGGGSYIKKGDDGTILLVAGGGGGSSEVRPLLIADTNNKRVLLIKDLLTANRQAITERLSLPVSVAYDAAWNIYVLDQGYNRIMKYSGTDLTFQYYLPDLDLKQPTNFVIDDQGTFYITDQQRLVSRTSQGVVKYIPLDFTPAGLCFSSSDIYLSDAVKHRVIKMDKKTSGLTTVAGLPTLNGPTGLTFRDENLYICDTGNNRLILNATVLPLTLLLNAPRSVYVSESHIYIADTGNDRIVRIDLHPDPTTPTTSTTSTILGSSGTGALQFRNPLCITGPIDYKSGMGYPGGQRKISSTVKDTVYQVASLGNTDWKTVTETQEVIEIQDTITVKAVPQPPRLGEGSVNNVYDAVNAENGTPGANYIGGNGGGILNPNATLDVKLAVPRDHGGLTITYLPKLKRLPATNMKIQPLRQEHTDSNVKYIYDAGVILGFTPEGLRTETEVSDVSDMPDSITHFVIELPNKSKYILLVG